MGNFRNGFIGQLQPFGKLSYSQIEYSGDGNGLGRMARLLDKKKIYIRA